MANSTPELAPEDMTPAEESRQTRPVPIEETEEFKEVLRKRTPVSSLMAKLTPWLMQQPEYPLILAAPRETRRQLARELAKHIVTIPTRRS